jgi:hypothetical protein
MSKSKRQSLKCAGDNESTFIKRKRKSNGRKKRGISSADSVKHKQSESHFIDRLQRKRDLEEWVHDFLTFLSIST